MAHVNAFAALLPPTEKAAKISAPPYDVVNRAEAGELAAGSSLNFLHVSRAEIDLPADVEAYSDAVYQKAAQNYATLKREAPLQRHGTPGIYVYALTMGSHRQVGIVATPSIDDYDNNIILKHEKTRQIKEDDRTRHILALRSQTGPVFLTYRDVSQIDAMVEEVQQLRPIFDFTTVDGVRHNAWRADAERSRQIVDLFEDVPRLYIADGHHRAAGASRARAQLRQENPEDNGTEPYNYFLAVIFPARQLQILAYHRLVHGLHDLKSMTFIDKLKTSFEVEVSEQKLPAAPGCFGMFCADQWWQLRYKGAGHKKSPVDTLDVSILQNNILEPLLGIGDPRSDPRIDFVGGIRGPNALERAVRTGQATVAFALYPTTIDDLLAIADAGAVMPPKSTWFEPKLRDGLFIHEICTSSAGS